MLVAPEMDGFAQLLEELPAGVVELTPDGAVTSTNQNAKLLLAGPPGEHIREILRRLAVGVWESKACVEHAIPMGRLGELRLWAAPTRWSDGVLVMLERNAAARSRLEARLMSLLVQAATSGGDWVLSTTKALETLAAFLPDTHLIIYEQAQTALQPVSHAGLKPHELDGLKPLLPVDTELIGRTFSSQKMMAAAPASHSVLALPLIYAEPSKLCAIAFPLARMQGSRGVLYVCGPQNVLQDGEVRLLLSLAEMLGMLLEQKTRDLAIRAERDRFTSLLKNLPDAVFEVQSDGRISMTGGRAEELFGAATAALVGTRWRDWVAQDDWDKVPHPVPVDVHVRRADGEWRVCSLASHPAPDDITRLVFRDVTTVRKLEAEAHAAKDAAAKNERLAILGRLSAGVGHELNNPLSYLATNLRALKEELDLVKEALPPHSLNEINLMLSDCDEGVKRLVSIVRALKGSSRQGEVSSTAEFDPALAVRNAVTLFNSVHRHKINITFDDVERPPVRGSSGALSQVVLNLMQNAFEAMGGQGALAVRSSLENGDTVLVVEVADNGPGIPEAVQAKLFEAFFTTKGEGVGTGLGLYLCRQLIEGMGGTLTFTTSSAGTTFFVRLPIATVVTG